MPIRLLIVDDASFIREMLRTIASKQGWLIVDEAVDGEEAITKARQHHPDVILMDIVMPKLNGIEAGKIIFKFDPNIAIIGLSTVDNEDIMMRAMEAGFVSYITKPFENRSVISAVNQASQKKEKKSG
ncbi:MAG: hypothetical protein RJB66_2431 [Pseudomonadota bacterium]|jgi:two-component system chemotaxis response regulator CheY